MKLNLPGQADISPGVSHRNENVPFNLMDNNALKELSQRLGTRATSGREFERDCSYFASEFSNRPTEPVRVPIGL